MRELDDDAAYMLLVTSNAQGELSALEKGLHALRSGLTERAYAEVAGRPLGNIDREVRAAKVGEACRDIATSLVNRFSQLVEIHAARPWLWPALVKAMLEKEWSVQRTRDQAVSFDEMVVLGKHGGDHGHGRDSKGRFQAVEKPQADNISLGKYGTSSEYTLARLDRDGHANLAAKVRAKEISANAAAIEAGFRRPPDPHPGLMRLRRAWEAATEEERAMFLTDIKPR